MILSHDLRLENAWLHPLKISHVQVSKHMVLAPQPTIPCMLKHKNWAESGDPLTFQQETVCIVVKKNNKIFILS